MEMMTNVGLDYYFAWALKVPAFVFAAALFFGAVEVFGK